MKIREMQARLQQSRGYKWWVLGMIMLGTFMAVLDVTVVNVGIPTIMSAFHIRISSAEWVITAYMITMTIMLPSAGWLRASARGTATRNSTWVEWLFLRWDRGSAGVREPTVS